MSELENHAIALIDQGVSIIPCGAGPDRKKSFVKWKDYQRRLPTKEEMQDWCRRLNPWSIAMITGEISRRITIDFDGDQGRALREKWGLKPHRRTPRGEHVDFEYPGWRVKTLNAESDEELGRRWPGLDIRGDGGYAIVRGRSVHGEYICLRDDPPEPLEKLPVEVREYLGLVAPPVPKVEDKAAAPQPSSRDEPKSNGERVSAELLAERALENVGVSHLFYAK